MKEKFKKYYLTIIISIAGIIGGYFYWKYVGCKTGSCPITSNWYTTVITGGLLGYLVGDTINDFLKKKKEQ